MDGFIVVGVGRQEVIPVAHGLDEQEGAVEDQRHDGHETELLVAVVGARYGRGEIGQDQGQEDEGGQGGERSVDAVQAELLFVEAPPAHQQAQADDAIEDDHHGGEHRVAGQGHGGFPAGEHERDDEGHLDGGDRRGEHQGAEWLADPVGDHFGVMDGGEHTDQQAGGEHGQVGVAQVEAGAGQE